MACRKGSIIVDLELVAEPKPQLEPIVESKLVVELESDPEYKLECEPTCESSIEPKSGTNCWDDFYKAQDAGC